MPSTCPICEQPISATGSHCTVCGFPTALAIEGLRSQQLTDVAPEVVEPNGGTPPRVAPPAPTPEAELAAAVSRDLLGKMALVRELGRSLPDATAELCQAALSGAEGRDGEALDTLGTAQTRMERELDELLAQRVRSVADRRDALVKLGVRFTLGREVERVREEIESGSRDGAVRRLLEVERRVAQFEADWKGLQGLLAQIEQLRDDALELGLPLGEITSEVAALRDRLVGPSVTDETLDEIAQSAAQTLMLLHEAIPTSLEEELARHAIALDRYPEEHVPSAVARRLHVEARRNIKKGRLPEAVQSVRELRRQIEKIEAEVVAPVEPPTPESPSEETEEETLDRLLKKARLLAARIRTLPPESETARDAAVEIRTATELLRTRRLAEADETLGHLMRMLSAEAPGE